MYYTEMSMHYNLKTEEINMTQRALSIIIVSRNYLESVCCYGSIQG